MTSGGPVQSASSPAFPVTPGSGNALRYLTVFVLGLSLGFLLTIQIDPGSNTCLLYTSPSPRD